jgi:competence ComEA-like helix-hairpin-helix protein
MRPTKVASIFVAALLSLTSCKSSDRPPPLAQDPQIEVYFNHNQARGADYTDPYRDITRPGDNLEQVVIDKINSAQVSIDLAVQELRLPGIAQALAQKQQAGVKIRVILENDYNFPWSSVTPAQAASLDQRERGRYQEFFAFTDLNQDGQLSPTEINQRDALIILQNVGIPILDDTADGSKGSGLMHHKFMVVDGQTVITGSTNLTPSGTHGDFLAPESLGNANNLVKIDNSLLASIFTQEFNLMWGDGVGGQPDSKFGLQKPVRPPQRLQVGDSTVVVQFSPLSPSQPWENSSNGLIGETLKSATESVNLALFVFSEQRIIDVLAAEQQQGVRIQALIDSGFAYRYYSEGLDMLGIALANKCSYEENNRPWSTPITTMGTPRLPQGDLLHHKFGVIDEQIVITGSHNWSAAANHNNDETVLVIYNPTVAQHYQREFERLYEVAALGIPVKVRQKVETQQRQCGMITNKTNSTEFTGVVNVNIATQAQLESLPGIGPKLAQEITKTRATKRFTSLEDLQRVSGIGSATVKKLEGKVSW